MDRLKYKPTKSSLARIKHTEEKLKAADKPTIKKIPVKTAPPRAKRGTVQSAHVPAPAPLPDPVPNPAHVPAPEPAPEPVPVPAPAPVPVPVPAPAPVPCPALVPAPEAVPLPAPVPNPAHVPAPEPVPVPAPAPVPVPVPAPAPVPCPALVPAPEAVPLPAPVPNPAHGQAPVPDPVPNPAHVPAPEPVPVPAPAPVPCPALVPAPEAVPLPAPIPAHVPAPMPDPVPVQAPVPNPAPVPYPVLVPAPEAVPVPRHAPLPVTEPSATAKKKIDFLHGIVGMLGFIILVLQKKPSTVIVDCWEQPEGRPTRTIGSNTDQQATTSTGTDAHHGGSGVELLNELAHLRKKVQVQANVIKALQGRRNETAAQSENGAMSAIEKIFQNSKKLEEEDWTLNPEFLLCQSQTSSGTIIVSLEYGGTKNDGTLELASKSGQLTCIKRNKWEYSIPKSRARDLQSGSSIEFQWLFANAEPRMISLPVHSLFPDIVKIEWKLAADGAVRLKFTNHGYHTRVGVKTIGAPIEEYRRNFGCKEMLADCLYTEPMDANGTLEAVITPKEAEIFAILRLADGHGHSSYKQKVQLMSSGTWLIPKYD